MRVTRVAAEWPTGSRVVRDRLDRPRREALAHVQEHGARVREVDATSSTRQRHPPRRRSASGRVRPPERARRAGAARGACSRRCRPRQSSTRWTPRAFGEDSGMRPQPAASRARSSKCRRSGKRIPERRALRRQRSAGRRGGRTTPPAIAAADVILAPASSCPARGGSPTMRRGVGHGGRLPSRSRRSSLASERSVTPQRDRAPAVSQSTRPSQRSRCSAYQRIVCRTPSSHETSGCQPVSRVSFSCPTRSAMTSLAPGRKRAGVDTTSRSPGQKPCSSPTRRSGRPSRASRCSRPARRRRRRRGSRAPRRSGGRGRRPCRSRSRASARAGRARPVGRVSACVMIVPVT